MSAVGQADPVVKSGVLLIDFLSVLYAETPVEVCVDYEPVFTGMAEDAMLCKFIDSRVKEAYISLSGDTLVISITEKRKSKKK